MSVKIKNQYENFKSVENSFYLMSHLKLLWFPDIEVGVQTLTFRPLLHAPLPIF